LPITIRKPRRSARNTNRPIREGFPRGSTTVLTDEANVASASPAPARNERTRSAITPQRTLAPEDRRHHDRDERTAPGAASCSPGAGPSQPFGVARSAQLDRGAHQRAVLGPRPVVVLDVAVPEQLVEGKPGVRGPLADPAVRDDLP